MSAPQNKKSLNRSKSRTKRAYLFTLLTLNIICLFLSTTYLFQIGKDGRAYFINEALVFSESKLMEEDILITLNDKVVTLSSSDGFISEKKFRLSSKKQFKNELSSWVNSSGYSPEEWNYNLEISESSPTNDFKLILQVLNELGVVDVMYKVL